MRSLVRRLPIVTLAFAALGPLIGIAVLFTPSFVATLYTNPAVVIAAPSMLILGAPFAYFIGLIPAAFTGFWVTLLATFTASKKQLCAGSAAIGATSTWLCSTPILMNSETHGASGSGLIMMGLIGAASAVACSFIFRSWPLGSQSFAPGSFESRNHRRARLAKARAARLAKRRAAEV